jgi:hypothetical protein
LYTWTSNDWRWPLARNQQLIVVGAPVFLFDPTIESPGASGWSSGTRVAHAAAPNAGFAVHGFAFADFCPSEHSAGFAAALNVAADAPTAPTVLTRASPITSEAAFD